MIVPTVELMLTFRFSSTFTFELTALILTSELRFCWAPPFNVNVLWFDKTSALETFTFQSGIPRFIGVDLGSGLEYRPRLNNNAIILGGIAGLIPGGGFRQLYNKKDAKVPVLLDGFVEMVFTY